MKPIQWLLTIAAVTLICVPRQCSSQQRVDGQWSAWRRSDPDRVCPIECKWMVSYVRSCSNPPPSVGGHRCYGSNTKTISEKCRHGICYIVDGAWGAWGAERAGSCMASCLRTVYLSRSCSNPPPITGLECSGHYKKEVLERCNGGNCRKEDGQWSDWSTVHHGTCSKHCKQDLSQSRRCDEPAPRPTGRYCVGTNSRVKQVKCEGGQCPPVAGSWSGWYRHTVGVCMATCQQIVTYRRNCPGGLPCSGQSKQSKTELCTGGKCVGGPVNGGWTTWKRSYGSCLSDCQRKVTYIRSCSNPPPSGGGHYCPGKSKKPSFKDNCEGGNCLRVDGQWSIWHTKTSGTCMSDCQKEVSKTRSCTNPAPSGGGRKCIGQSSRNDKEQCTGDACIKVDGHWSAWLVGNIATCSSDCHQIISSSRSCTNPSPQRGGRDCSGPSTSTTRKLCSGGDCVKVDGQWSAWVTEPDTKCPPDCYKVVHSSRSCTNPAPVRGGRGCAGQSTSSVRKSCTGDQCVRVDGMWSSWIRRDVPTCSSDCHRIVTSSRSCTNPAPWNGGRDCSGQSTMTTKERCSDGKCHKVDGQWSEWNKEVGSCQSDCQRVVHLTRSCSNPAPSGGGRKCLGRNTDALKETCTGQSCFRQDGQWSSWRRIGAGLCLSDCRHVVSLVRTCTNPPPSGGGRYCSGHSTDTTRDICTGGGCLSVDGQWSAWTRGKVGTCMGDCKRIVHLTRECTNPAPSGGGRSCVGQNTDAIKENCNENTCVRKNGQWSAWTRGNVQRCSSTCERAVSYSRTCTKPVSSKEQHCKGSNSKQITERCKGGQCTEGDTSKKVDGQWSAWEKQAAQMCRPDCQRTVSFVRTCTNPAPSRGGLDCSGKYYKRSIENCTEQKCEENKKVDGQWSVWGRQPDEKCKSNCHREVVFTRTCSSPAPSGGGLNCIGKYKNIIKDICTGGACVNDTITSAQEEEGISKLIIIGVSIGAVVLFILIIACIICCCMRKRRQKKPDQFMFFQRKPHKLLARMSRDRTHPHSTGTRHHSGSQKHKHHSVSPQREVKISINTGGKT